MSSEFGRTVDLIERVLSSNANGTRMLPKRASGKSATLVIATRQEIVGAGIAALLQAGGHSVVARCSHPDDLLGSADAHRPDIVMMEESIVRQLAAKAVLQLRARNRAMAIIFVIEERDASAAAELLELGVEGVLSSGASAKSFIDCVDSVYRGRKWVDPQLFRHLALAERSLIARSLTSREVDVALLISRGLRNKEIARALDLTEGTIKMHLHHIYEKLNVVGRTQLALAIADACARMSASDHGVDPARETAIPDSPAATTAFAERLPKKLGLLSRLLQVLPHP